MKDFFDNLATAFERIGQALADYPQLYGLIILALYLLYMGVKK